MNYRPLIVFLFLAGSTFAQPNQNSNSATHDFDKTLQWQPSNDRIGCDATVYFKLKYFIQNDRPHVQYSARVEKGDNVYFEGSTYTKAELGSEAYNAIRVSWPSIKADLYDGSTFIATLNFRKLGENDAPHPRGWLNIFVEDMVPGSSWMNDKRQQELFYSQGLTVKNIRLDHIETSNYHLVQQYHFDSEKQEKSKAAIAAKENAENKTNISKSSGDDFWNGKTEAKSAKSQTTSEDFWNGKSEKVVENDENEGFWNGIQKTTSETKIEARDGAESKDTNLKEVDIDSEGNLIYKTSKERIYTKEEYVRFSKKGAFFEGYLELYDYNTGEFKYAYEDIESHNRYFLFDKFGNILIRNASTIIVNPDNTILVVYLKKIEKTSQKSWQSLGGYYKYVYRGIKLDVYYDYEMNILSNEEREFAKWYY